MSNDDAAVESSSPFPSTLGRRLRRGSSGVSWAEAETSPALDDFDSRLSDLPIVEVDESDNEGDDHKEPTTWTSEELGAWGSREAVGSTSTCLRSYGGRTRTRHLSFETSISPSQFKKADMHGGYERMTQSWSGESLGEGRYAWSMGHTRSNEIEQSYSRALQEHPVEVTHSARLHKLYHDNDDLTDQLCTLKAEHADLKADHVELEKYAHGLEAKLERFSKPEVSQLAVTRKRSSVAYRETAATIEDLKGLLEEKECEALHHEHMIEQLQEDLAKSNEENAKFADQVHHLKHDKQKYMMRMAVSEMKTEELKKNAEQQRLLLEKKVFELQSQIDNVAIEDVFGAAMTLSDELMNSTNLGPVDSSLENDLPNGASCESLQSTREETEPEHEPAEFPSCKNGKTHKVVSWSLDQQRSSIARRQSLVHIPLDPNQMKRNAEDTSPPIGGWFCCSR